MTALASTPRFRIRPVMLFAAAMVVVVVSQLTANFSQAPTLPQAQPAPVAAPVRPPNPDGPVAGAEADLAELDANIKAWTINLSANDKDFYSATNLGLLYDARARLTGDVTDYQRAIEALNRALATEPAHLPARILHARALAATHDFGGALAEARAIEQAVPTDTQVLATIGDASLELGDYATAADAFNRLQASAPGAPVTARLARLAFLRGDVAGAGALAQRAIDESVAAGETGPAASWYSYLAGTISINSGKPADALAAFDAALALWPESYLATAGRGRALAGLGRIDEAISAYAAAVAIAPQPDALASLGDLYAMRGDQRAADEQYATVDLIAKLAAINEQVYNRQLALFWLNHDRNTADALRLATAELRDRKDVYGWDAYAWALLASGRVVEADDAARNALALGTQDAALFFHAGVIAQAAGDPVRARSLLESALALPGALDPLATSRAQLALETLR